MRYRHVLIGVTSVIAAIVAVALWLYMAFVRGEHRIEKPGGHWVIEFISYPGSYGGSGDLYLEDQRGRVLVATVVHTYRYYGDDCLAYSSSAEGQDKYFFACGRRRSVPIGPESRTTWEMAADSLRQQGADSTGTAFETGQAIIKISDLKKVALTQPLR